jgi:hypothetical protein
MSKGITIAIRVVGLLFLSFSLLSFLGGGRADDVVDKTAFYLSFFLIHFPLLVWLQRRGTASVPASVKVKWSLIGVGVGLVVGYLLWNALLFVTIEVIRGGSGATNVVGFPHRERFDMRASWGVLSLAVALALLIASKPYFSVRISPEVKGSA